MNSRLVRAMLIVLVALIPTGLARGQATDAVEEQTSQPASRVTIRIHDVEQSATMGAIVATGTLNAEGLCEFPPTTVIIEGGPSVYDSVTLKATEYCQLVLVEVVSEPYQSNNGPSVPQGGEDRTPAWLGGSVWALPGETASFEAAPTATHYYGYSEITYYEQFSIAVTTTGARMSWWDNGSSVYGGTDDSSCWWRSETGWYLISCVGDANFTGPSNVWRWVKGEYNHNTFDLWHRTTATVTATPGGNFNKSCAFEGNMPPLWYYRCYGSSFPY